jgi:hypothetical protein
MEILISNWSLSQVSAFTNVNRCRRFVKGISLISRYRIGLPCTEVIIAVIDEH